MKKIKILISLLLCITLTGCFEGEQTKEMVITTSVYPIEYVVQNLYGEESTIDSIYPKDIEISNYKVSDVLLEDYKSSELFIFNGLSKEKDYVKKLKNNNENLKIIDVTSNMTIDYKMEELWLDPNNMLTIANNIKEGFNEYINIKVVLDNIEKRYEQLKVALTSLDGKYYQAVKKSDYDTIIVSNNAFKYLEKYGLTVISLDKKTVTSKDISDAKALLSSNKCKYIFINYKEELDEDTKKIIEDTKADKLEFFTMTNLTGIDTTKEDYITLSNQNLENLKKELYK